MSPFRRSVPFIFSVFLHPIEISSLAVEYQILLSFFFGKALLFVSLKQVMKLQNMKCLCCNAFFEDRNSLREQYVTQHCVHENNYFFKKLFTRDRFFAPRKCLGCEHFCLNRRDEKGHNFLAHYQQGGSHPVEDKPIERRYFDEFAEVLHKFLPAWRSL